MEENEAVDSYSKIKNKELTILVGHILRIDEEKTTEVRHAGTVILEDSPNIHPMF